MAYVRALFILQFHLARHSLTHGKLVAYFALGFVATAALAGAGVLAWLCYMFAQWLPEQPPAVILLSLNVIMLVYSIGWFWGLVMEVQRSDIIDIRKMLHFPVPLPVVNAINFAVSLIGFTPLLYLAGAAGLLLGLSRHAGASLLAGALPALAFFFLSAAWAYYLRGLLVVWMENKRRRRLLLTLLPFVFMIIGFAPMLLSNYIVGLNAHTLSKWLETPGRLIWVEWLSFLHPGGLLALATTAVATGEGHYWLPALLLAGLGAWGYHLGYRTSLRYGYGESPGAKSAGNRGASNHIPWTARKLPLLHEETAALAQALFLNFVRHPQVRTMLLAPLGLIILLAIADSRSAFFGQKMGLPIVAILWPFFMFSGLFFNLFGIDQRGFRTIMLLPIPRYRILLAYHLALFPLAGGMGVFFALLGIWYCGLGLESAFVSLVQILQLYLNFSIAGAFVSIYAPMTIGRNMMRKQQGRVLLVSLCMPIAVALLVLPTSLCLLIDVFLARWGLISFPLAPALSIGFVALTLAAYPFILRHAGDLLVLREQRILAQLVKTAS